MTKSEKDKKELSFQNTIKIDMIQEFMKKKNWTEQQFAERCHISLLELRNVLRNRCFFEPITILRISRVMGIEFADLVRTKKKD